MPALLSDLRVVEVSAFVAAPIGGMTLGQLGADVIRVDPIGGSIDYGRWPLGPNGRSLYWASLNKGKRSVALALDRPEGRELALSLAAAPGEGGGILLTNLPGRGWLDYANLSARRADAIMLRLAGDTDGGTAVDYTVNSASGFPMATGDGRAPVNHVLPAWDVAAGLYLATGLLAAERHRTRTGRGQKVSLSLADVMLATVANLGYVADVQVNGGTRGALGNDLYGAYGRDFPTGDGRRVMVVAISVGQWKALGKATGLQSEIDALGARPGIDLATEGGRYLAREEISAILAPWFASRPLAAIGAAFKGTSVLWGPYQTFEQLVADDPRCSTANPMFQDLDQPGIGPLLVPDVPLAFGALPRGALRPAPTLGENTDEVLADVLGLSGGAIGRLHDTGVAAGP